MSLFFGSSSNPRPSPLGIFYSQICIVSLLFHIILLLAPIFIISFPIFFSIYSSPEVPNSREHFLSNNSPPPSHLIHLIICSTLYFTNSWIEIPFPECKQLEACAVPFKDQLRMRKQSQLFGSQLYFIPFPYFH